MIIKASACSWGKGLASHLMKDENDHVHVEELRGFVSNDLHGAFAEAKAVSLGTKCKNYLFSVSFNPPESANCTPEEFRRAADKLEERLGLTGQPRAIVLHEKEGRSHAHCVWSRIDAATMRAPELPYYKNRCKDVSRELFIEHGWAMPRGLQNKEERSPLNYTRQEHFAAKRRGENPAEIKKLIQDCWNASDSSRAFERALESHAMALARGDRRGCVVIDHNMQVHSLSRVLGQKQAVVAARVGDTARLPSVEEAQKRNEQRMGKLAKAKVEESRAAFSKNSATLAHAKMQMTHAHREARAKLRDTQARDWTASTRERQARMPKGLKWLWSCVKGDIAKIKTQNESEAKEQTHQQQRDRFDLESRQREERRVLQEEYKELRKSQAENLLGLRRELGRYLKFAKGLGGERTLGRERVLTREFNK